MNKPQSESHAPRFIISGGGTGGHIFPALSIADALRRTFPGADILFVGAEGRMEMEKVPAAGYPITALPVRGLYRKLTLKNLQVLYRLLKSIGMARRIIRQHRPDVVIGVGGYASAPVLWQASRMHIPTVIQEQNSYAGITNKWLAKRVNRICVAYPDMQRFFPAEKIVLTGNPIREVLEQPLPTAAEARAFFGLQPDRPTILSIGGSLGAATINRSIARHLTLLGEDVQLLWQTGAGYYAEAAIAAEKYRQVKALPFIARMEMAYAAADLVISRAGACSISELCLLGKACILVPSPNVAEDHQTKNAMALSTRDAAILIRDADAGDTLLRTAVETVRQSERCETLARNIRSLAQPHAADAIAAQIKPFISHNA
ncbi:MAG: undecaprenyldiphospho-muramoylpentapeptide beta-N-acetylglucosaminyltransferase [Bacteroidales bacterium]|nr:undecaprenyldiphospho-muramoylpentapeptide beta-N-acetylglucosaminyltransferase [Bacteroidales bacterium]